MSELVFEEPPTNYKQWITEAQQLKTRPGEWAIVSRLSTANTSTSLAANIRAGRMKAFMPGGTFEAVSRKVDGEWRVYARYVGGGAS